MNKKPADIVPSAPVARPAESRLREAPFSGFHDSSRDLAGGLQVTEGTVSALPFDLRQALLALRATAGRQKG